MNEVDGYSRGIVKDRNRLYWEDFKRMPSCMPPYEEQKIIADYLDANAIRVRRFIRNRRRMIEVLNEHKQAIINRAVTRGLDSNAPLKPSGIDWLGNIPEHWQVYRIKQLLLPGRSGIKIGPFGSAIKSDIIFSRSRLADEPHYKVYGQEHPIGGDFSSGDKYLNQADFNSLSQYELFSGDIVITMMGTTGQSKVVPQGIEPGIMDSHLIRIRVDEHKASPEYVSMLICEAPYVISQIKLSGVCTSLQQPLYIVCAYDFHNE